MGEGGGGELPQAHHHIVHQNMVHIPSFACTYPLWPELQLLVIVFTPIFPLLK